LFIDSEDFLSSFLFRNSNPIDNIEQKRYEARMSVDKYMFPLVL